MIRTVVRCPYCGDVSAGFDADRTEVVMAPDGAGVRPCGHLAFLTAWVSASWDAGAREERWHRDWLWVRGHGFRPVPADQSDSLFRCAVEIACEAGGRHRAVGTEYRVARMLGRGDGEVVPFAPDGRENLRGIQDALALYAPVPDALVAVVRRMAEECVAP